MTNSNDDYEWTREAYFDELHQCVLYRLVLRKPYRNSLIKSRDFDLETILKEGITDLPQSSLGCVSDLERVDKIINKID